jgi:hypothetical protein
MPATRNFGTKRSAWSQRAPKTASRRLAVNNAMEEPVMIQKRVAIAVASAIGMAFAVGVAVGKNAPTENKGVSVSAPTFVDLT